MASQTILVIEDEASTSKLLSHILRREGYQVHTARTGPEGLRLAHEVQPDLIILDIVLPGMDGYEVCRYLRADPDTEKVPILMLTAMGRPADQRVGFEMGADDYITKPFVLADLLNRIRSIFFFSSSSLF